MDNINIQRTILATIIFLSESLDIDTQKEAEEIISKLDAKYFDNIYARVILKWVEALEDDLPIPYATDEIQEALDGTKWISEWLEIIATTPIPTKILSLYYRDLKIKKGLL